MFRKKEKKEQKSEAKLDGYLKANKLDELDEEDKELIRNISDYFISNEVMKAGAVLKSDLGSRVIINQNDLLIKQNWIMIRKLDQICKKLDK